MRQKKRERLALRRLHEAVYQFSAAERNLTTRYKRARGSLSTSRVMALNVLIRQREATAGTLAREAGLRPNSITAMLEQLERSGVVARRQDETDRRVWWISLTEKGRGEIAELQKQWDLAFDKAFADTPDRDLEIASEVLERLAEVFLEFDAPDNG